MAATLISILNPKCRENEEQNPEVRIQNPEEKKIQKRFPPYHSGF
jgi:hypothetical protein